MDGTVFHTVVSEAGHLGVQSNHSTALMVIGYRSPYASTKVNKWLERKMIKLYTKYYFKVLIETKGRFWEDAESKALAYYKGGAGNGSKV